jgi:molybdate transport system ATP-binding protein
VSEDGLQLRARIDRDGFSVELELAVPNGEVLGVIGPNGAGKTTLLRALSGLLPISAGRIVLNGEVLDDPAAGRFVAVEHRPVGLVFQNYRLFPHLSVADNIGFGPRSRGAGRRAAADAAAGWLDRFGLSEFASRRPAQLSGGQAQRVALARALASGPQLLLLDEPLSALDAQTRLHVRAELRRHLRDFDGPTLLVTHDPLEAMVMTDRLLVLEGGRIVQQGRPAEVARRPATQYVARLVGLNLYRGIARAGGVIELTEGGSLIAAGDLAAGDLAAGPRGAAGQTGTGGAAAGEPMLVAVRPGAIALYSERPEHLSARNVWPGRIVGLELLEDRVRVQVTGSPGALVDITAAAAAELDLAEGGTVWLSAKATEVQAYPDPA